MPPFPPPPVPGPPAPSGSSSPLPVCVVASVDPVLRDVVTASVLCDVPGAVVLRYDVDLGGPAGAPGLRRVVADLSGVVEDVLVPLQDGCPDCAQREDVLVTVAAVAASGRWSLLVLALPVGAEPTPLVQALAVEQDDPEDPRGARAVTVRSVVAAVGAGTFAQDLLGDALLGERALACGRDDERAVGEALAHQLDEADLVLTDVPAGAHAQALLRHLCGPGVPVSTVEQTHGAALAAALRTAPGAGPRTDLRAARHPGVPDGDGVWTLELTSPRALHPGRLLERIEDLGAGRLRARGVFWLPTRPDTVCAWDGAGGQLSIGDLGTWGPGERRTRLVVTGTEPDERDRLRRAFAAVLATEAEEARCERERVALPGDGAPEDGFEPWLGSACGDRDEADLVAD
ncbi:CobW family GTP-binding protein [Kineococcus sp. SYSU DK005]|uniref:CobW family GTP-binding protein n=1 Tax=Kineococcus sp. SYSU DK005 TaxID=3383126 RepID=UPI003D7DFA58